MAIDWKSFDKAKVQNDSIFIVHLISREDPDNMFMTLCSGTQDLALFLLHYDKSLYEFAGAEELCSGNKMIWNHKELLTINKKEKA